MHGIISGFTIYEPNLTVTSTSSDHILKTINLFMKNYFQDESSFPP